MHHAEVELEQEKYFVLKRQHFKECLRVCVIPM